MTTKAIPAVVPQPKTECFSCGPWTIFIRNGHILQSEGSIRQQFESHLDLPQIPEMTFAENVLQLYHEGGFGIEFNAFDALHLVDAHQDFFKVSASSAWIKAREESESEFIKNVVKPFDWTYSTDYKGTLLGDGDMQLQVTETSERLDLEKLKVQDQIYCHTALTLFEDELADNGTAMLYVKMRVMGNFFFILLRFHMRVDNVVVRVRDTRIFHEVGTNYILREYTAKEKAIMDMNIPLHILKDQDKVADYLDKVEEKVERLTFPASVPGTPAHSFVSCKPVKSNCNLFASTWQKLMDEGKDS